MAVNWDKFAKKFNEYNISLEDRVNRIMEQKSSLTDIEFETWDDMIPTPKEIVRAWAEKEAMKEIIKLCTEVLEDG